MYIYTQKTYQQHQQEVGVYHPNAPPNPITTDAPLPDLPLMLPYVQRYSLLPPPAHSPPPPNISAMHMLVLFLLVVLLVMVLVVLFLLVMVLVGILLVVMELVVMVLLLLLLLPLLLGLPCMLMIRDKGTLITYDSTSSKWFLLHTMLTVDTATSAAQST